MHSVRCSGDHSIISIQLSVLFIPIELYSVGDSQQAFVPGALRLFRIKVAPLRCFIEQPC